MGLYRPTLNSSFGKRGVPVELDDNDLNVRRMVAAKHLMPADDKARNAQNEAVLAVDVARLSKADRVRQAMEAARAAKASTSEKDVEEAPNAPDVVEADELAVDAPEGATALTEDKAAPETDAKGRPSWGKSKAAS